MNNKILYCVASLAAGAVVGSAVAWFFTKRKYESEMQEKIESEVNSVKESLTKYYESNKKDKIDSGDEPFVNNGYVYKHATRKSINYDEATAVFPDEEKAYTEEEDNEEDMTPINNPDVLNDIPYSISPEEFGDYVDYEPTTLYYYADGVLADEDDNEIEDPVAMVGDDFMDHYGEYEDDCVYVRNDRYRRDYEILRSEKTFAEQQAQKYSDVINSPYLEDEE